MFQNHTNENHEETYYEYRASSIGSQLGCGSGVTVNVLNRSCSEEENSPWAVKHVDVKTKRLSKRIENTFLWEASLLKSLNHPNIVAYKGLGKASTGHIGLLMECAISGSLYDHICERDTLMSPDICLKIAGDIAFALSYLHFEKLILHGDVKSSNVLIFGPGQLDDLPGSVFKLCDFGNSLSLKLHSSDILTVASESAIYLGSKYWAAPEALDAGNVESILTDRSDIWSYGCFIFELITLDTPHLCTITESLNEDEEDAAVCAKLGRRPVVPEQLPRDYVDLLALFVACTREESASRPSSKYLQEIFSL